MSALDRLRLHYSRDPVGKLRRVQRRFWATPQRPERAIKPRRFRRRPIVPVMAALAAVTLYLGIANTYPTLPAVALNYVTDYFTYFPNCTAARAAGAAPIYRGQPGYRPALDRDNDGIACELWPRR